MKNKLNYILIGILVSFSFMNNVFAEDTLKFELYVDESNIEVVSGTDAPIMVGIKSNDYIYSCDFEVVSDGGVEFVSVNQMVGNYNALKGEKGINVTNNNYSGDAPVNGVNIMQLNYKVNSSGKVIIKTVDCITFEDEKTGTYKDIEVNFVATDISEDNTLKKIEINGEMVSGFSPDGNNYLVNLKNPNFSLSYETTNPDYQDNVVVKFNDVVLSNLNNIVWSDPSNQNSAVLELIVNNKKTYTITVQYVAQNLDNTLKSLKINGNLVDLQSGKTNYSVKVGKDVSIIEIEAVLNDSENFKISEPFVNGKLTNDCSKNSCQFQIEIIPIDNNISGSSLTYTIDIVKESDDHPSSKPVSKPESSDIEKNPPTGDISMFLMISILISSLVGSVFLYQKNKKGYK